MYEDSEGLTLSKLVHVNVAVVVTVLRLPTVSKYSIGIENSECKEREKSACLQIIIWGLPLMISANCYSF